MIKGTITPRQRMLHQGEDATITVTTNDDCSTATELEYRLDSPSQVIKKLSAGEISTPTSTGFTITLDAADTTDIEAGIYKHQARVTLSGKVYTIRFTPDSMKILDSVFVDSNPVNDYGGA